MSAFVDVRFAQKAIELLHRSEMTRMGWTGRAPPRNSCHRVREGLGKERNSIMPHTSTVHAVTAIGIDMGKNTLHMVGLDSQGAIV